MSITTAGLDGRAIVSKSLLSFGSGLTLIIKRQTLSSTNILNKAFVRARRSMNILPSQMLFVRRYYQQPHDTKQFL